MEEIKKQFVWSRFLRSLSHKVTEATNISDSANLQTPVEVVISTPAKIQKSISFVKGSNEDYDEEDEQEG